MLNLSQTEFRYEPYPIGYTSSVFPEPLYRQMLEQWPDTALFEYKPKLGYKYSLSELNNPDQYRDFVASSPVWRAFREHVKSAAFIGNTLEFLEQHKIELDIHRPDRASFPSQLSALLRGKRPPDRLSARFEFSMMPTDGGCIRPHTDAPQKIITLVIAMNGPGEWDESWGGGTEIVRPRDPRLYYNQVNRWMDFKDVETVHTFPFLPNQCVTFIKTFNSWHSVSPLRGSAGGMRRTLTINIEKIY